VVAVSLKKSRRSLEGWRVRGDGPPFVRVGGAVRYDTRALEAWINARTVQGERVA